MAFPSVVDITTGGDSSATSTHTVSLPSSIVLGQRLIGIISRGDDSVQTTSWPAGWTEKADYTNAGAAGLSVAYRDADGTEGASIDVTTSGTSSASWAVIRLETFAAADAPEVSAKTEADASSLASSANLTPSYGSDETMWITAFAAGLDPPRTILSYPPNYGDNNTYVAATGSGERCYLGIASRDLEATSENPGNFTLSGIDNWVALTIGVRGAAAAAASFTLAQTLGAVTATATMLPGLMMSTAQTLDAVTLSAAYELGAAYDATYERFKRGRSEPYREFRQPGGRRR